MAIMLITGLLLWASVIALLHWGFGVSLTASLIGAVLIVVVIFLAGFWSRGRK